MINLFIDSNIWLSLYHFTSDDLEQFKKLERLIDSEIKLFIPMQVYNEVFRNREAKLKEALNQFEKFELVFPAFCKEYPDYTDCYSKYRELKKAHKNWIDIINKDIIEQKLPVDNAIQDFFNKGLKLPCTDDIITKAIKRYNVGNPPGKDRTHGDAINWECLLMNVPIAEDLFFISSDKDYYSIIDNSKLNPFLENEWKERKKSTLIIFRSLVDFLKQYFKDITLKSEKEKEDLIVGLENSPNFATTHSFINALSKFSDWNDYQIERMCQAAISNSQIKWILRDDDIKDFYSKLVSSIKGNQIDLDVVNSLLNELS